MRPVNKGTVPGNPNDPNNDFNDYSHAKSLLIERIGAYCSYCERKLVVSLAVEHVEPKSLVALLEKKWDNFLLACTNCNSTKSDKPIDIKEYVWPHRENTYNYFAYNTEGLVMANPNVVDDDLLGKINNSIKLVGLDKKTPNKNTIEYLKASDHRHTNRMQALSEAYEFSNKYATIQDKPEYLNLLISKIKDNGHWTIWMKAFSHFPEVQEALIDAFPGTAYKNEILDR